MSAIYSEHRCNKVGVFFPTRLAQHQVEYVSPLSLVELCPASVSEVGKLQPSRSPNLYRFEAAANVVPFEKQSVVEVEDGADSRLHSLTL